MLSISTPTLLPCGSHQYLGICKRNCQFSLLYTFGIVFVVAGHSNNGAVHFMTNWFPYYSFHLALFSFCSGYHFPKNQSLSFSLFFRRKLQHLILPFYAWNFVYGLVVRFLKSLRFSFGLRMSLNTLFLMPIWNGHQFMLNCPSWFVPPHVFVQLLSFFPVRLLQNRGEILSLVYFLFTIVVGMSGIWMGMLGFDIHSGFGVLIPKICYFYPFFSAGVIYRLYLEKFDSISNTLYFTSLGFTVIVYTSLFGQLKGYKVWACQDFDGVFAPLFTGLLGIAFWLRVTKILAPSFTDSNLVKVISNHTFSIMMHHLSGFLALNTIFYALHSVKIIDGFNEKLYFSTPYYTYLYRNNPLFLSMYVFSGISFSLGIKGILIMVRCIPRLIDSDTGKLCLSELEPDKSAQSAFGDHEVTQ